MMEKYYNKINELKELKNVKIKENQINSYNKEISLLKEKQNLLYDDFINNYNHKKNSLDFKLKNKISQVEERNKKEIQHLNKNKTINNKNIKNKDILILEKKINLYKKLGFYIKAEETEKELKEEKNKLII